MTQTQQKAQKSATTSQLFTSLLSRACLLAFTCSFSALAEDNEAIWYIGNISPDVTSAETSDDLSSTSVSVTNIAVDDNRTGWKLNVGFDVTNNVAIEAGYMDLKDVNAQATNAVVTDPGQFFNTAKQIHPNSTEGFTVGSVYRYNITDNLGLTGSVGLFNWEGDVQTQSVNPNQNINNDGFKGTDLYFGVGGGYQLTQDVTLSIEWERYQLDNDNTEMWSIGVNYHFK